MPIPESQLSTWSRQGATVGSANTYASVKQALKRHSFPYGMGYEVYLQGSYPNYTNIRGDSDVDVVVETDSIYYSNLSESERYLLKAGGFDFYDFKEEVIKALQNYYGHSKVDTTADKCIKLIDDIHGNRLPADIIPCVEYKRYYNSIHQADGMTFWTKNGVQIINYPKLHLKNGSAKNKRLNGYYKPNVRVFKNARNNLRGQSSNYPSYFIECLLYNVSDYSYKTSYAASFEAILIYLLDKIRTDELANFVAQNGQVYLFGYGKDQIPKDITITLINELVDLWNSW